MASLGFHCHRLFQVQERILDNGLARGEFYHFPPDQVPGLRHAIAEHKLAFSIHTPLVRPEWYPDPPTWSFLCFADAERRALNLRMVELTLEMAADIGAEYVVVHFPSPSAEEDIEYGYAKLRDITWDSAERLAELSLKHKVDIHVEGFGPSPFLNPPFIVQMSRLYPNLRYCFDIAHMHIAAQRDGFDFFEFAEGVAPRVGSIHLWNVRDIDDYVAFRHIPVHPKQRPEDGWVDVPRLLTTILTVNPDCRVIFEAGLRYPPPLGDYDVHEGIEWVKSIIAGLS